jgi:hypothetical protein
MTPDSGKNIRKSGTSKGAGAGRHAAGHMPLVEVRHLDSPPKFNKPKRIHPRRLLPFVAEGPERGVHSMSSRVRMLRPQDASQDIQVLLNTPLTQPAQKATSSNVGEPSVSINDDVVVFTGNWYSAVSTDGGKTFQFVDPNSMAQPNDPPNVTFCCDQVVNYMPSIDTFVWLLQYGPSTGDNIQRLAFATTDQVKNGSWHTFDITTQFLGLPGFFMDFPDLAVGSKFLYMTTNAFDPSGQTVKSAVVRMSFDSIANGNPAPQKFVSDDLFSLRVAQNVQDVAYFAAHRDTSTLAVFSWPEGDLQPASKDVPNARWIGTNGYISRTPDGRRWLDRADPRITGATLSGKELWFSWGVDSGSNQRAQPFVQMARINTDDMSLIEDVNLFDTDSAICYGGLATNANGDVGVSYAIGGAVFPSHVVGFMSGTRNSVVVGKGDRSPLPDQDGHFDWGDYLTVRPVFRQGKATNLFAATGYSMLGTQDGGNQDATPRLVIFSRSADAGAPPNGGNGGNVVAAGGNGGGGNGGNANVGAGPITDVNQLPTVSSSVAAQIKAACGVHVGVQALAAPAAPLPQLVTKPGSERWPVKTGQDPDRNDVGKNVINGQNLGAGIVPATVEELMSMPRPAGMENAKIDPPQFQAKRNGPIERTIWRVDGFITVLKQEADGDYHLVVQGNAGDTIVAEVPTPTTTFIGDCPWLANIQEARQAVDDKLVHNLNPQNFVLPPGGTKLVPRSTLSGDLPVPAMANFAMPESFLTPAGEEGDQMPVPTFQTAIRSVAVRITGVGFFDRDHGQTGRAPNIFELHPVLKVEFL